jgi:hypothetical protein
MRKSNVMGFGIAAAVFVLALVLNPSPERHREKIRDTLGVASYTSSGERTLSVGALGMVYVMGP